MELLRRDTDLTPQSELTAVGKTRGGVDVYRGTVDLRGEAVRVFGGARQDRFAVLGGVRVDMRNRLLQGIHNLNGKDGIQIFGRPVLFRGFFASDQSAGTRISAQLYLFHFQFCFDQMQELDIVEAYIMVEVPR